MTDNSNTQLHEYQEKTSVSKVVNGYIDKKAFVKVVLKNAPTLLSAFPVIGNVVSAVTQTTIATGIDYLDEITSKKREDERDSHLKKLEEKLQKVEINQEAKEYFENSIIFKYEDIMRKLLTEPGRGFDEIFASFIANSLADLDTPPEEKDMVLSSLLSIDKVDIKILKQIDIQFNKSLNQGKQSGAEVRMLEEGLLPEGINKAMISRSLERLQAQDLIQPLTKNTGGIQEMPTVADLHKGIKSEQYYSTGGFIISEFGRTFVRLASISAF